MSVTVHYTRRGVSKSETFDDEQAAGLFMDGIYSRDDHSFEYVEYDERVGPHTDPRVREEQ